jgi:O-antigen/teichoic acid export membrane protein
MGIVQRQSAWNLVSGYLGVLLGALNALILFPLAFPNPENMGGVRWLISASLLLGAVAHLGWPQTMVTFLPKIPRGLHAKVMRYGLLLSAVVLAVLALGIYHPVGKTWLVQLSGGGERDELAFLLPMAVAYVGFELFAALLIHAQQVILPYWLKDAGRKGWLTLLLLVRISGFLREQTPFLLALLLGYVLQALWIWYRSQQLPTSEQTTEQATWPRKAMLNYSGIMLLTVAAQMAFGQLDILMVGAWLGLTAVAHYSIAFNFGIVVSMPMKAMNASLRPIIAKLVAAESWDEVRELGERSLQSQWLASGWIFLVALSVSPWAFTLLPANYQGGLDAVLWIAAAQVVNVSTGPSGLVLVASKSFRWELYANAALIVFALVLGYGYIPEHGVTGAAQVIFLAMVLYNAVKLWALHRLTGHVWLGVGFAKSLLWLLGGIGLHALVWAWIEGPSRDQFGIPMPGIRIETLPIGNQVLYPVLEICLHTAWTFVGLRYLGLAPDLRTFLVKLFSRLRA